MITTTYNPNTHKLVPLTPTEKMLMAPIPGSIKSIWSAMLAAAPTPPQPEDGDSHGGVVKALMWVHDSNADDWSASTVVGLYAVGWVHRQFVCILRHVGTGDNGGATDTRIASGSALEEAKVAAQADYERRIRSALTTEPAKAVARPMEDLGDGDWVDVEPDTPPSPSADLREALEAATVRARYLLDRGADDLGIGEVDSFIRMVAALSKQEGGS